MSCCNHESYRVSHSRASVLNESAVSSHKFEAQSFNARGSHPRVVVYLDLNMPVAALTTMVCVCVCAPVCMYMVCVCVTSCRRAHMAVVVTLCKHAIVNIYVIACVRKARLWNFVGLKEAALRKEGTFRSIPSGHLQQDVYLNKDN